MIIDQIAHSSRYAGLHAGFAAAFDFLRSQDLAALPLGRIDLQGDALFALVQEYQSKPASEGFWEAHRRYIDLQYIVSGCERIGWAPLSRMESMSHDAARDLSLLKGDGESMSLQAGDFMLLWPEDAHMPGLQVDGAAPVRKVVFKIAV